MSVSLRLACFYAAYFAVVGVVVPYWPLWLKSKGLDAGEIGILLSAVLWVKVISNPLIAQAADRRQARRGFMAALAALSLLAYGGFAMVDGFAWFLVLSLVAGIAFSASLPLGEAIGLAAVYDRGLDYGRIRLWGSLTFIAASVGLGHLLGGRSEDLVLWSILALLALTLLAVLGMPSSRPGQTAPAAGAIRALLGQPVFLVFLATTSMIHASHAVFYGFATLHWRSAGLGEAVIGWLWAEGVLAEILLFAVSNRVVARLGVANLLAIAAAGAVLRWLMLGLSTDLVVLIPAQALHGATFGAAHLAAMHFIARAVEAETTATAQSLNAAVAGGIASGLGMLLAGWLFGTYAGAAFLPMALVAALGLGAALLLRRRWDGGRL
jgi:PPP family 3-phenylpropionic acid transporter